MEIIFTALPVIAIAALAINGLRKERNKYLNQRDALLALLDSEGRGREAVEAIKCYR